MRRSLIDMQVGAVAVVVAVAGLSLGGLPALAGLGLAAAGSAAYFTWLRPESDSGKPSKTTRQANDVLWADTEKALRLLDRYPADGELIESVTRLGRLGRRAVEKGRRHPADISAAQTRHVLCLAAETLAAYMETSPERRRNRGQRMQQLLDEAAESLARQADSNTDGDQLCIHLRVLEQELKSTQSKGQDHESNDNH